MRPHPEKRKIPRARQKEGGNGGNGGNGKGGNGSGSHRSEWTLTITSPTPGQVFSPPSAFLVQGIILSPVQGAKNVDVTDVVAVLDKGVPQTLSFAPVNPTAGPHVQKQWTFSSNVPIGPVLLGEHVIAVSATLSDGNGVVAGNAIWGNPGFCTRDTLWQNWAGSAGIRSGIVWPQLTCTPSSLADVMRIIRNAEAVSMHVHAFTTKWSMSDCSITPDNMIDMRKLDRPIQKVQQALNTSAPDPALIYHIEAGITIKKLYQNLDNGGLPLGSGIGQMPTPTGDSPLGLDVGPPLANQAVPAGEVLVAGMVTGVAGKKPRNPQTLTARLDDGPDIDETNTLKRITAFRNIYGNGGGDGGNGGDNPPGYRFEFNVNVTTLGSHTLTVSVFDNKGQSISLTIPFVTFEKRLALQTMTGSGSISLGGAISTGSHGGDRLFELTQFMPPLADNVLAIHLVGAGGTQYWIEPSNGITDPKKLAQLSLVPNGDPLAEPILPQNIIYDDSTFEAVLVSLGCVGVIYSVVLQVLPQYDLIETTEQTTWSTFKKVATGKYFNDPNNRFLELVINPYYDSNSDNQCIVISRTGGSASGLPPCVAGDVTTAVTNMVTDMINYIETNILSEAQNAINLMNLFNTYQGTGVIQGLTAVINYILEQAPELRQFLLKHYGNVMTAWWPPAKCGGRSYTVMDTELRSAPGPTSDTGGYSIEVSLSALDSSGNLAFANVVDTLISQINSATSTFLGGWVAIRFTGGTRASLGMQQWGQTCAIEISTLPFIDGELPLIGLLLETMLAAKGLPHWGQLVDQTFPGHGSIYARFEEWRNIYAKFSNNFTTRTFENALSARWQLTSPPPVTFPVEVPSVIGQRMQDAATTIQNAGLNLTAYWSPSGASTVISQRPMAGCRVPPGWMINVVLG